MEKIDLRIEVSKIKTKISKGMSYKEAEKELQPFIDEANKQGQVIAKKYNKRYNKLTFTYLIR